MHFSIVVSPRSTHQQPSAIALKQGLERHGHTAEIGYTASEGSLDVVVTWGWRAGRHFHEKGREVMIMERSYLDDRFHWTSFGWNGLNGHASFAVLEGDTRRASVARWERHFCKSYTPRKELSGEYALICGQVQGDASLRDCENLEQWYWGQHKAFKDAGIPVFFRDHPKAKGVWAPAIPRHNGDLKDALRGALVAVAWNSNSLVDAVMQGVPIYAGSPGCMAHAISQPSPIFSKPKEFDIDSWGADVAMTQWTLDEVAAGDVIPIILQGQFEEPFSKTVRGKYDR
jgi:hypothetical protein